MCQSRSINSSTLVPSSEAYYEKLVGKHENSTDIYGYTQFEILKHVNKVLLNDNHSVLKSILLMSSHSSILSHLEKIYVSL